MGNVTLAQSGGRVWSPLFESLYRENYPSLVRLAFLMIGSAEEAEELVQDVFVRAQLAGVERPVAYLRRAVVNACRNHHRHRDVERRGAVRLAASSIGAEAELDHLADALGRLPARQRSVLVLRYWMGCSEAEIASILNCRPGTVKSLSSRGLAALREVLA